MDKKLSKIDNHIKSKEKTFYKYLYEQFEGEIFDFLLELENKTDVYIFSGIIRNYFLHNYLVRDLDIVVGSDDRLKEIIKEHQYKKNSFGGYKIHIGNNEIDIWSLESSWAFKEQPILNLYLHLPDTAFFNFSSIIYYMNERKFIYNKDFTDFLKTKEIDYVFQPNANYPLCIVNTFYYSQKYNLKVSSRLSEFIKKLYENGHKKFEEVQIKHFKRIMFSNEEIEGLINYKYPQ